MQWAVTAPALDDNPSNLISLVAGSFGLSSFSNGSIITYQADNGDSGGLLYFIDTSNGKAAREPIYLTPYDR